MEGPTDILTNLMQNRTTAEFVLDHVKRDIITGALKPGQRLVERELTERYQVSRTPVREALKRLERTQLVVNIPYRGVEVRRVSYDFARDIYDLRLGVEGLASYLAAQRGTEGDLARLEQIFAKIVEYTSQGRRDDVMLLNNAFHKAIAAATHNQLLAARVDEVWIHVNLVRATAWKGNSRSLGSRQEHEKILRAILARQAEAARAVTEEHIRSSWAVVEESLLAAQAEREESES